MKHKIAALCALCGALLMSHTAQAVQLIFAYDGSVLSCPDTGLPPCGDLLFPGDDVNGMLVADIGDDPSPALISSSQFISFAFQVGQFIEVNSANSMLVSGVVYLDSGMHVTGGFLSMEANAVPNAPTTRITLSLGASFWAATVQVGDKYETIANGVGKIRVVPVPGAIVLFAPALFALFGLRRRG